MYLQRKSDFIIFKVHSVHSKSGFTDCNTKMFCWLFQKMLPKKYTITNTRACDVLIMSSMTRIALSNFGIMSAGLFYIGLATESVPLSIMALLGELLLIPQGIVYTLLITSACIAINTTVTTPCCGKVIL